MNPENPPTPREEIEMRLTALLMRELPPEEAAAIQARMAAEPELAALHGRLCKAMELLREASALPEQDAPLAPVQLSSERRERLLAHFQKKPAPTPAPAAIVKKPRRDWSWVVPLSLAAAVIVVIGGGLMMPASTLVQRKSARFDTPDFAFQRNENNSNSPWTSSPGMTGSVRENGGSVSGSFGTMDTSSLDRSADASPRNGYAMLSTPAPASAPRQYQIRAATISPSAATAVAVPSVPKLVPSSLLDAEPTAAAKIPPVERLSAWNLGKVEVANSGETTANFQLQDGAIPEDQKRPFSYDLNGTGGQVLSGSNTFTGGVTVAGGTLSMTEGRTTSGVTVTGHTRTEDKTIRRAFPLDPGDMFNTATITGAGGLTTAGSSILTLTGSNTYTGATTMNGGTLSVTPGATGGGSGQTATIDPRVVALSVDPNNQAAVNFEKKIARPTADYGVASANETRADTTKELHLAWARPVHKSVAVTEIQQNNRKELDFGWLKDAKAPENTGPLVAQSRDLQQDMSKLVQDMIAAAPKNEEIGSLLAKYSHVDTTPAAPAPHGVTSSASAHVPAQIDHLARTEIAQKAESNLLRDMAVASLKNREIRDLLAKHGYTVNQPATLASGVTKSAEEASDKKNASSAPIPQPEIPTSENAFSTFSLNVSDVSFKLAEASLQQGRMPDPATVRSEEFINAFDYRDPEPAPGVPLAFAAERARYPFAQNRDLLRFSVKTAAAGRQPGRPLNIVLLLDKSGSMERADRVNIVHEALRILAAQLQPQDKLSIVTFARTPRLWADGVAGDKAAETIARVGEITPEGGTNLEAALDLGYATAQRHYAAGSINRVVLFTDGAANLGDVDPDALTKKVETHRKQGVALDCFGIGWEGYNDDLLEQLTRHGDGRYGFINTADEAAANFAAQLAGALQVAASDVKVQVEFNPKRVTAYRQIGYAKHQLTKEQFRDNSVAAAQIGAAESGNALYVVEVDPRGEGDLATVRVRFRVPGTSDYREHEWTVPFSGNVPPLEQGSSALRLAGTASAFSEMLAASPYASDVTSDRLLGVLEGVPAIYGADPRPKQLEWMIRQARSLSGR